LTTNPSDPIRLKLPRPPDADFEQMLEQSLSELQQLAPGWTDHNVHDPGITLLETALWGVADLHYRTANRDFTFWALEAFPELRRFVKHHQQEILQQIENPALSRKEDLFEAIRRLAGRPDMTDEEVIHCCWIHDAPPALTADDFEDPSGKSRVWPPHPLQVRPREPVTGEQYLERIRQSELVARAWLIPGIAEGVAWDGTRQAVEIPDQAGAFTLLIDPAPEERDSAPIPFLSRVLSRLLYDQDDTDLVARNAYRDWAKDFTDWGPRRLLGDQIGAALLSQTPVVVKAHLFTGVGTSPQLLRDTLLEQLREFLRSGRTGSGWEPGRGIRVSEVIQLFQRHPEVRGVEHVALRATTPAMDANFRVFDGTLEGTDPFRYGYEITSNERTAVDELRVVARYPLHSERLNIQQVTPRANQDARRGTLQWQVADVVPGSTVKLVIDASRIEELQSEERDMIRQVTLTPWFTRQLPIAPYAVPVLGDGEHCLTISPLAEGRCRG
jgi:hypothetical protein